jgi:hypothetical protein
MAWNTVFSLVCFEHARYLYLTTDSFVVLGLYADLPIAPTTVHFDGTSVLSLHIS